MCAREVVLTQRAAKVVPIRNVGQHLRNIPESVPAQTNRLLVVPLNSASQNLREVDERRISVNENWRELEATRTVVLTGGSPGAASTDGIVGGWTTLK